MSRLTSDDLQITNIEAFFDAKTRTDVKETDYMLFYKTQVFYCKAQVQLPRCTTDCHWSIGLVQACDFMHLSNTYSNYGHSLWEFHPLKCQLRQLINDSDGRQYPFYSVNHSLVNLRRGSHEPRTVNLQIKDYFHPSVVWELPYQGGVQLSQVTRRQRFHIWLVALKHGRTRSRSEVSVLKQLRWEYNLSLQVDAKMPVGQRVRRVADNQERGVEIFENETFGGGLPSPATQPPHCNAAQSLIWYPRHRKSTAEVLVPPKQVIVPWDQWVRDMLGPSVRIKKPEDVFLIGDSQR